MYTSCQETKLSFLNRSLETSLKRGNRTYKRSKAKIRIIFNIFRGHLPKWIFVDIFYTPPISYVINTILKINFRNFAKSFIKKILTSDWYLIRSKLKVILHIGTQFLVVWGLSWCITLLVLAVVLATLAKPVVILKLGLGSMSKRMTGLMFLKICTLPRRALTRIVLFVLK